MITEKYVSFETAKLLKDKGFDEPCSHLYRNDGMHVYCGDAKLIVTSNTEINTPDDWVSRTFTCTCPTLQMAKDWLRVEKKLYIQVDLDGWALGGRRGYYIIIQGTDNDFEDMAPTVNEDDIVFFHTPEEATEAAIRYCLENLI